MINLYYRHKNTIQKKWQVIMFTVKYFYRLQAYWEQQICFQAKKNITIFNFKISFYDKNRNKFYFSHKMYYYIKKVKKQKYIIRYQNLLEMRNYF